MNRLNNDIINLIVEYIRPEDDLSWLHGPFKLPFIGYANISRQWREAVQRRIFSNVELKDEWIGPFACVFAIPQRRALLRQLHFFIRLPTYSEGRDDHDANTAAFGHAIHRLFAHLVTDPETVFG